MESISPAVLISVAGHILYVTNVMLISTQPLLHHGFFQAFEIEVVFYELLAQQI